MEDKSIVNLTDLPEKIYIILKPSFKDRIIREFIRVVKTKYNANKLTGIPRVTLSRMMKKNVRIRLDFLLNITRFTDKNGFSSDDLEKKIVWIGDYKSQGIVNPKLPFNFNSREGARFIAAICNEGWISDGAYYSNTSHELRDSVKRDALFIFGGDDDTVREWIKEKDQYLAFPSVIKDVLVLMTKFKGVKSENNPPVPKFILKEKNLICGWIEQTIADEGHVKYGKKVYRREINWKRSFSRSLKEYRINEAEKHMLEKLGIGYNIYNTEIYRTKKGIEKIRIKISITGRENLLKLRKLVCIPMKRKDRLFTKMMGGFVRYKEPLRVEEAVRRIFRRKGHITSTDLKKEMGYKDVGTAIKWLNLYIKQKKIICSKDYSYGGSIGRIPAQYALKTP